MTQVRITGGLWRSQRVPVCNAPGLRPTPDRVRETLFNWLGQDLSGWRCLDLFAGSGILGIEAASRGAAEVLLIERDRRILGTLQKRLARLNAPQIQTFAADAVEFAQRSPGGFDLIFADPPYRSDLLARLAPALERLLVPGGWLYAEAPAPIAELGCCRTVKQGRAGQVCYHLLQRQGTPPA